jgi:hypothetical protein
MGKKGQENSIFKIIISIILFGIFLVILIILAYLLYQNIPGQPEISEVFLDKVSLETGNLSYLVKQFYPNMKFNHKNISYNIDIGCSQKKNERMKEAFYELEKRAGLINFYESTLPQADIEVSCSEDKYSIEEDYFIAGEGGAKEIIQTKRYNVITKGVILLHGDPKNSLECEWANIELHELLHVFGFDHSFDKESLMYPYLNSCSQKLDESIINDLKVLYSQLNLADLYFSDVSATKKGRYLDFNVSIKNSGVINAQKIYLSVLDDGKELESFEMKDIPFGAGINFYVTNLKLNSRNSDNVELVIDRSNFVQEIDEENNVAKLKFS